MEFNLHALRLFDLVAQLESISRAADVMYISQPAVTKQIRNLEEALGFRLVETYGRGIKLTEAGEGIAKIARRLRGIEADLNRYASSYRKGHIGELKISATYLPANYVLPHELAAYKQRYPRVRINCTTSNAEKALRMLLDYDIDIAFIGGQSVEQDGVKQKVIKKDEIWFIIPSSHKFAGQSVTLREMLEQPFVLREEGSSLRNMLLGLCRTSGYRPPQVGMQVNGSQETIRLIAAGYGAGFVSALEVKEAVERGEIARVYVEEAKDLRNTITVCIREGEALPPAASFFYAGLWGIHE